MCVSYTHTHTYIYINHFPVRSWCAHLHPISNSPRYGCNSSFKRRKLTATYFLPLAEETDEPLSTHTGAMVKDWHWATFDQSETGKHLPLPKGRCERPFRWVHKILQAQASLEASGFAFSSLAHCCGCLLLITVLTS